MRAAHRFLTFVTASISFVCSVGCGNSTDNTQSTQCPFDYSSFNGASPTVSLKNDLLADRGGGPGTNGGIIRRACTLGTACHNALSPPGKASLMLGPALDEPTGGQHAISSAEAAAMVAGVMKASLTYPPMQVVKPGEPANSFLMDKVDGCLALSPCKAQPGAKTTGACGDPMPQSSPQLSSTERDTIRRWIAQGALNDFP